MTIIEGDNHIKFCTEADTFCIGGNEYEVTPTQGCGPCYIYLVTIPCLPTKTYCFQLKLNGIVQHEGTARFSGGW